MASVLVYVRVETVFSTIAWIGSRAESPSNVSVALARGDSRSLTVASKAAGRGLRLKSSAETISALLPDCDDSQSKVRGVTTPGIWWINSAVSIHMAGSPAAASVSQAG